MPAFIPCDVAEMPFTRCNLQSAICNLQSDMFILDSLLVGASGSSSTRSWPRPKRRCRTTTALREQLLEAQMRLELGEMSDDEFATIERDVLARIREIKGGQQGPHHVPTTRSPASTSKASIRR